MHKKILVHGEYCRYVLELACYTAGSGCVRCFQKYMDPEEVSESSAILRTIQHLISFLWPAWYNTDWIYTSNEEYKIFKRESAIFTYKTGEPRKWPATSSQDTAASKHLWYFGVCIVHCSLSIRQNRVALLSDAQEAGTALAGFAVRLSIEIAKESTCTDMILIWTVAVEDSLCRWILDRTVWTLLRPWTPSLLLCNAAVPGLESQAGL